MTTPDERLDAALGAAGAAPSPAMLEALGQAARDELAKQPKARAWWPDALVVLALNLVMGLGAAALLSTADTQHASSALKYAVAGAWLAVTSLGSAWWLRPGPVSQRWAVGALFTLAAVLAVGNASGFDPGAPFFSGMRCALAECSIAFVPVTLVVLFSLRFAARPSHLVAGSLASAAAGTLALHFHCGNGTLAHVLTFHLLPAGLIALAAAGVRSLLRPRSFVP